MKRKRRRRRKTRRKRRWWRRRKTPLAPPRAAALAAQAAAKRKAPLPPRPSELRCRRKRRPRQSCARRWILRGRRCAHRGHHLRRRRGRNPLMWRRHRVSRRLLHRKPPLARTPSPRPSSGQQLPADRRRTRWRPRRRARWSPPHRLGVAVLRPPTHTMRPRTRSPISPRTRSRISFRTRSRISSRTRSRISPHMRSTRATIRITTLGTRNGRRHRLRRSRRPGQLRYRRGWRRRSSTRVCSCLSRRRPPRSSTALLLYAAQRPLQRRLTPIGAARRHTYTSAPRRRT